jgi:hypothetical protein
MWLPGKEYAKLEMGTMFHSEQHVEICGAKFDWCGLFTCCFNDVTGCLTGPEAIGLLSELP